jgi:hypothetical protein
VSTVTPTTLIARYPEFTAANTDYPNMVLAAIADAELMVGGTFFGDREDMAVKAYAAHLIAINPLGELARLDKRKEETTYLIAFERIKRASGAGFRVI